MVVVVVTGLRVCVMTGMMGIIDEASLEETVLVA